MDREKEIRALFALAKISGPIDFEQHCIDQNLTVDDARYMITTVTAFLDADPGELGARLRAPKEGGH